MDEIDAPGRLAPLLAEGLRGHHLLFDAETIRAAFAAEDRPVARADADDVGTALLAICKEPLEVARQVVAALGPGARTALVRLYFRLLERAGAEPRLRH
jgi:hypothetical protein